MSFYTGRYMFSHGANWNNFPLRLDEWTMADYLRPLGMRVALVGKTHMKGDTEAMARLGLAPESAVGRYLHVPALRLAPHRNLAAIQLWKEFIDRGIHERLQLEPLESIHIRPCKAEVMKC